MNVRCGNWFIEEPYKPQASRFNEWIHKTQKSELLVIEIGSGFNTPGVVRWPMEQIVFNNKQSHFIRINLKYPQVPKEIADRSITFKNKSIDIIEALWNFSYDQQ
jgi:hypothetical protein